MTMSQLLSPIEQHIDVVHSPGHGPEVFTNKFPLWRPGGSRGIFGGIAISQSLRAAQMTVQGDFSAHSMHCTFIFAGNPDDNIYYHVERVRDGKSFCTRFVRAVQRSRPIFMCTVNFTRVVNQGGQMDCLQHGAPMPSSISEPGEASSEQGQSPEASTETPFINHSVGIVDDGLQCRAEDRKIHQWIRPRVALSHSAGPQVHQAALAFMSDSYFLAAVPHIHEIWDFVNPLVTEFYPSSNDHSPYTKTHTAIRRPHLDSPGVRSDDITCKVSMMVSLDHTIYFHNIRGFCADQWLLAEIQSSWAGDGRGIVHQRIWTKDGTLVATCIQEVSLTTHYIQFIHIPRRSVC